MSHRKLIWESPNYTRLNPSTRPSYCAILPVGAIAKAQECWAYFEPIMTGSLIEWLRSWGELSLGSGIALAFIFVVGGFILFPRTLLCFGVGAIFGPVAILIVVPSTTMGGILAFLLARYLVAASLQRKLDKRPRLRAIADAVDSEGWRVVALLRLGSPIPNAIQNYLFGITRIRLLPYTVATFLFTIPQVVLYVYIGAAGRIALLEDSSSTLNRAIIGIGALCLTTVAYLIWRKARMALRALPRSS
jgi:uncharacterized membrane protein YdjX (TVP38/TMEM64 family)